MRYYYYGREEKGKRGTDVRGQEMQGHPGRYHREDGLVIDEDSVYEIDMECIHCKEKAGRSRGEFR